MRGQRSRVGLAWLMAAGSVVGVAGITVPAALGGPIAAAADIGLAPGFFQTLDPGGTYNVTECGLDVTMAVTETASNVNFFGGDSNLDPGLHMSNQFGAQNGGFGSSITLTFSQPINGLTMGFEAQQAEEEFTFSQPGTSVTPELNSTYGIAPPVLSRVSLQAGGTQLISDMTDNFGSTLADAFGANSTVDFDFATPQTTFTVTHSGPINDPRNSNGATTYNGTIVNADSIDCDIPNDTAGLAKRATEPAPQGDGNYLTTYTFVVENLGTRVVDNLQVVDDLAARFGVATAATDPGPGQYRTFNRQIVTNTATPHFMNNFYDGSANQNLLASGFGSIVPGESLTFSVDVLFEPDFGVAVARSYPNNAQLTADSPTNVPLNDTSTDGADPDPNGDTQPDESTPTVITVAAPSIGLVKTSTGYIDNDGDGDITGGDVVQYEFLITNTGGVPLTGVGIDDDKTTDESCPQSTLAVGESITCTGTYTPTQPELFNLFSIVNTATASGFGNGVPVEASDVERTSIPYEVTIQLDKIYTGYVDNDLSLTLSAGDNANYDFVISAPGTVSLSRLVLNDPLITTGFDCSPTTTDLFNYVLVAQTSITCTGSLTVSPAQEAAQTIVNTADVVGRDDRTFDFTVRDDDTETVVIASNPSIVLDKRFDSIATDTAPLGQVSVGDTISYEFEVINDGDVPLTNVAVTDTSVLPNPVSALDCGGNTTLAVNASFICTATYLVDQADVDQGSIINSANAVGTSPNGVDVDDTDSDRVNIAQDPSIQLEKSFTSITVGDGDANVEAGETIEYTFVITNDGDVTLSDVTIEDPLAGLTPSLATAGQCGALGTLAPGGTTSCTAEFTMPSPAVQIDNTATASGQPPNIENPRVSDTSDETVTPTENPDIRLDKNIIGFNDDDGSGDISLGDTVNYTFTVTNTGDVALTAVAVSDPLAGLSAIDCGGATTLAVNGSFQCTASYLVELADVDAVAVVNQATASGQSPGGVTVEDDDDAIFQIATNPSISLVKSFTSATDPDGSGNITVGDVITYTFEVTNTGDTSLRNIVLTDPLTGFNGTCGVATLPAGSGAASTTSCTDTYLVTVDDANSGTIDNTAVVNGETPREDPVDDSDDEKVIPDQTPSIQLTKSVSNGDQDGDGTFSVDDVLTYTLLVENTGSVTLTDVTVTDVRLGITDAQCGSVTELDPGETTTCDFTLVVDQADVNDGRVDNTATAEGTPPVGPPVEDPGEQNIIIPADPQLTLVKSVQGGIPTGAEVDDVVTFEFLVTNTGNVTMDPISVTDTSAPVLPGTLSPIACGQTALDPDESVTCTATYTITQDDVDNGSIVNTATSTGQPPTPLPPIGDPPVVPPARTTPPSTVTIPLPPNPSVSIVKTLASAAPAPAALGSVLTYQFVVTNDGNVRLTDIVIDDPLLGGAVTCTVAPPATLAPTDSFTCVADTTYTVDQDDVDIGERTNLATVTAQPPTPPGSPQPPTITNDDPEDVPLAQTPGISIDKEFVGITVDNGTPGEIESGDTIEYRFTVTNTGNVTLNGVGVRDVKANFGTLDSGNLIPAQCGPDTTLAPLPGSPNSTTCTTTYVVTTDDIISGSIVNTAEAIGQPPTGPPVDDDDTVTVVPQENPSITIDKSLQGNDDADASGTVSEGDTLTYQFVVTNDGDVPLSNVVVADTSAPALPGALSAVTCPTTTLDIAANAPADTMTCAATYLVSLADVIAGTIANNAEVTGDSPGGSTVTDDDDDLESVPQNPSISLDKTFNSITNDQPPTATTPGDVSDGDTIEYGFTITNNGNVPLTGVNLDDAMLGQTNAACGAATTLAPGASTTCSFPYTVLPVDVTNGFILNSASAGGTPPTPPGGAVPPEVTDDDDETITPSQNPSISIDKTAGVVTPAGDPGDRGDIINYVITVTNTGDVDLTGVVVNDPLVSDLDCDGTPGAPFTATIGSMASAGNGGIPVTCSATHTIDQVDIDAGRFDNTADVTGQPPTPPSGIVPPPVTDDDDETVTPLGNPSIAIVKSLDSVDPAGPVTDTDTLNYEMIVTNTGDVTLVNVVVTDTLVADLDCDGTPGAPFEANIGSLAVGAAVTCTASHVVDTADIAAGTIDNTATVDGETPTGTPVSDDDDERITPQQSPAVGIAKSLDAGATVDADGSGTITRDDTITYQMVVTNTGDVTLTDVTVTDPLVGLSAVDCVGGSNVIAVLPVGAGTVTCTATLLITQTHIDAGRIANLATVSGQPPVGPPVTDGDPELVTVARTTDLTLVKSVAATAPADISDLVAGDALTYSFLVTNTGTVTLSDITITDPLPGLPVPTCPAGDVAPAGTTTCSAAYTVTQDDIDNGSIENVATATGTPPFTPEDPIDPPTSPPSDAEVPIPPDPSMTILKSVQGGIPDPTSIAADDVITYEFLVTNTGNVTLTDVAVTDPLVGLSAIDCGGVTELAPATTTDPAGAVTCTATYTITQDDVNAGNIANSASTTGQPPTPPSGTPPPPVTPPPSDVDIPITPAPAITLVKSVRGGIPTDVSVDDVITYEFLVTNTGNVTLTTIAVTDPLPGLVGLTCPTTPLAPTGTLTCTATYTVIQQDLDNASIDNSATATGTPPPAPPGNPPTTPPVSPPSDVSIPIPGTPSLTIDKDVDGGIPSEIAVGDTITYTFLVTNTGNQTLSGITVEDPLPGLPAPACITTTLLPSASTTCDTDYVVTPADITAGIITNTAIAVGQPPTPPGGTPPPEVNSPPDTVIVPSNPVIVTTKRVLAGPTATGVGSFDVTYEIQVANGGNVVLTDVQIVEDLGSTFAAATSFTVVSVTSTNLAVNGAFDGASNTNLLAGTDSLPLAEGGSVTLVVNVTPGAAKGPYLNSAVGVGTPPVGDPVDDPSDSGTNGCASPCDSTDPDDTHPGEPGDTGGTDDPTPVTFPTQFDLGVVVSARDVTTQTAVFDLTVTNGGPDAAPGPITVTAVLPPGLSLESFDLPPGFTASVSGNTLTVIAPDDFEPGDTEIITLRTRFVGPGPYVVDASVRSSAPVDDEIDQTNNVDQALVDRPTTTLPSTGSDVTRLLITFAAYLLVIGAAAWAISRRRSSPIVIT